MTNDRSGAGTDLFIEAAASELADAVVTGRMRFSEALSLTEEYIANWNAVAAALHEPQVTKEEVLRELTLLLGASGAVQ